ncbi:MAG: hypothetical protein KF912_05560 [Phycisphaeraceae bacterium]|nr:hypothetical protein [Phycisphaeraceae bacterium]QYK46868.1 MAG: hypothetical protein KF838_08725 [Phycisphaeraceae bacterium]
MSTMELIADQAAAFEAAGRAALTPTDLAELLGAFNEVTERLERTHGQLRAEVARLNAELERANEELERSRRLAAIGEMAAGIAHEVRNPVGSIKLYARMLEDDLADHPASREIARKIAGAAKGLDAVVGDVLAFAREMRPRLGVVEGRDLLDRALEQCADVLALVPGGLRTAWAIEGDGLMVCDHALAERAVLNIIRNAVEAMAESGPRDGGHELVLGARQEWGARGEGEGWSVVWVRDSGPGMSDDVIARMFNPFYTTRAAGTGLGLSIVHRIMEAHGGRVVVRRERPSGACVELWWPLRESERLCGAGLLSREHAG